MIEHTKEQVELSRLILTPPKIGSSRNTFFWNIWPNSEKFVPTIGQPHETKPVTTKDISGVHSCISRKMNDCFLWVCLSSPTQCLKCAFVANLAQCMQILSVACGWEWDYSTLRAAKLTGLSSFQKHLKPRRYTSGPNFANEIWGLRAFQRESIFCSKISSGGSSFMGKLVPGGTNFGGGGGIFTMTEHC